MDPPVDGSESSTASPVTEAALVLADPEEDPAYQVFIDSLSYLPPEEVDCVREAYRFSEHAHRGQKRLSGEPYITHPLAVAGAIAEWQMDVEGVVAALLHDVMEDTRVGKSEIAERFGKPVADLVDGLSKLDKIEFQSHEEAQAENFRKMLMAMARDLRVVLIKLADRHHNLQTMAAVRADKRRRIARETLEIYAPIAGRLGLNNMFRELQDLSFKLIYPMRARVLARALKAARGNRRELLSRILDGINGRLQEANVEARVFGREKSLYSIYRKMLDKRLSFSQVLDVYGFRVLVKDVPTAYLALGALHGLYKPVPGKFKDYIAIPKPNGYQSLHTTLIGPHGTPFELQIRTEAMETVAQEGIASHWLYKDSETLGADLQQKTTKWFHSLLDLQSASGNSSEFLEHVKVDLFPHEIYVFTPKGKIIALPRGATAVDLAYAVHTDIGNHCVAAQVNFKPQPLLAELTNGDRVEIVTAADAHPNLAWLSVVRTGRARSKIRHYLKSVQHDESTALGEKMLDQELRALGVAASDLPVSSWKNVLRDSGNKLIKEVYTDIGLGFRLAGVVARRLLAREESSPPIEKQPASLVIRGTEGMAVQFAPCCQPIPGDPIIGSLWKGKGLVIHTHDCPAIRKARSVKPTKWIDVEWEPEPGKLFSVRLLVMVHNTLGALGRIATEISRSGTNIEHVNMEDKHPGMYTTLHFTVQVASRTSLARLMRSLRRIPEVVRITRDQGLTA
ncbi:MAG TPA: bifunctional (p)ppGpp synthetase/guanosine-3',5'-bis(diphosphate) 3'-pyrophosphohydrolase [Accumulibacter sp.]|uniref:RelA/SpoT family protein n=1 Tax=Accumulibacter sp. TaxID=2053492 RepID=UPI0025D2F030|nr:bifunctional (p)ppGpp synthetase/guanosine-3',5'-bis(diphosphate) 3'-pyrophosphohydrolase [Accumulibacter sp.]MCM8600238.1 bifunctional (p)ppGpp synthetase/guanosine-3',5'-bis(diphosphate) 3'-pyrophosphohydrolase [Accumulibacter sp.]MCM8664482.1 bifunctional (p)ppGpp synthetase/guanosine-3',5'-bis(diphosphate) 3'-pyrophosphohydrolase [Accumulibacter sp.]HNC51494.1 bifunctional (p)ppGpp synthetase/guanosine-3',5'-bis(diphosphate) 3'-pyrophosphohydrolase [Accumulibacter sp.]